MKPVDVKPNKYIEPSKKINYQDPKFKIVDVVFCERLCSKSVWGSFLIKKVKSTVSWEYFVSDLKGEESVGRLYEKELQKTIKKG